MLAEYKKKAGISLAAGLAAILVLTFIPAKDAPRSLDILMLLVFALAWGVFIYGCSAYARGKGHHGAWGALGLFFVPGLVVLSLFRDKYAPTK